MTQRGFRKTKSSQIWVRGLMCIYCGRSLRWKGLGNPDLQHPLCVEGLTLRKSTSPKMAGIEVNPPPHHPTAAGHAYDSNNDTISYHFLGRCVWIIGACSLGSSTSPTQTGVYTLVFHSVRQFARCRHRSEKPWEGKKRNVSGHYI